MSILQARSLYVLCRCRRQRCQSSQFPPDRWGTRAATSSGSPVLVSLSEWGGTRVEPPVNEEGLEEQQVHTVEHADPEDYTIRVDLSDLHDRVQMVARGRVQELGGWGCTQYSRAPGIRMVCVRIILLARMLPRVYGISGDIILWLEEGLPYLVSQGSPEEGVSIIAMRLIEEEFILPPQPVSALTLKSSELLLSICEELGLNLASCHFSLWIFHCNTLVHTFHKIDRFVSICASVVLGMKIGECLKRVDDVITVWRKKVRKASGRELEKDDEQTMKKLRERVLRAEVNLMMTFEFDLDIKLASEYMRHVEKHMNMAFFESAHRGITDFYKTPLVLYFPPHLICLGAILLAHKATNIEISTGSTPWYTCFCSETTLEQVQLITSIIYKYLNVSPHSQ